MSHPIAAFFFFFAEVACWLLFIFATVGLWSLRYKPEEGIPVAVAYSVDVFIPTYSEPLQYLEMTLRAASRIEYDGEIAWYMLDDAGRSDVEHLAKNYGFHYLSRPKSKIPNENAKAGNLNFGFRQSHGDCILVLDADQVAQPNILKSLIGYMRFETVAFVQSKQSYLTQEGDPFYNKSQIFYEIVQLGMDNNDTALSSGSGVLYRRAALESIGGFVEWNIVEDLTTSYELHAHGWKSFYFPHRPQPRFGSDQHRRGLPAARPMGPRHDANIHLGQSFFKKDCALLQGWNTLLLPYRIFVLPSFFLFLSCADMELSDRQDHPSSPRTRVHHSSFGLFFDHGRGNTVSLLRATARQAIPHARWSLSHLYAGYRTCLFLSEGEKNPDIVLTIQR